MHLVWKLLQKEEALPYLCDWEYGAGGWEKEEKSCQNAYVPESEQDEEKGKRRKVRMS